MKLNMTIEEALEFADEWSRGLTLHEGSQGWRVVCMLLAHEVRRLRGIGGEPMRVIAVEAIRTVTGRPDIKGNDGKYLVDVLMDTTQQWVTSNALANAPARTGD